MNVDQLEAAIVSRLGAVSAVTDLLGSVPGGYQTHAIYTMVPQADMSEDDSYFPFIKVGPATGAPWDTDDTEGAAVVVPVNVTARDNTLSEVMDAVYDALHRFDLVISGANTVDCLAEQVTGYDGPDGVTRHRVCTFRVTYDSI